MRVLGLDPGTQNMGYALIEFSPQKTVTLLDWGTWRFTQGQRRPDLGVRLFRAYGLLVQLLEKGRPEVVGLEKTVSFRNVASAHKLSEMRGVLRMALAEHSEKRDVSPRLWELSPTAIKRQASGLGGAKKSTILRAMQMRIPQLRQLGQDELRSLSHDAFDALAIAWTAWIEEQQERRRTSAISPRTILAERR